MSLRVLRAPAAALVAGLALVAATARPAHAVSRQAAASQVISSIITTHPYNGILVAYGLQNAVAPGTVIGQGYDGDAVGSALGPSWVFWLDLEPLADFAHMTEFVLVDTLSGSITLDAPGQYWPNINGVDYYLDEDDRGSTPDRIYSGAGFAPAAPRLLPPARGLGPERVEAPDPTAGKWALIVSAEDTLTNGRRKANVDSARTVLNQVFGVPTGNMTIVNNPTKQQVCDSIAAMAKRCPKLYIYWTGHGFKGGFVMRGGNISAAELASKLKSLMAGEYCAILSPCHSGSFLPVFRDSGLTGFHMAGADSDSLSLGWCPGQDTWVGNFFDHFLWGCLRSGLRGQAAFVWARDSTKHYLDSLKAAHPEWRLNCMKPASNQVFVATAGGQGTTIAVPPGTGTVCVRFKTGTNPAACGNASLYCLVFEGGLPRWKLVKIWNWNLGQVRYFRPFGDPNALGIYRLVFHSNRYPACGEITFTNDLLAETPSSQPIFPAMALGNVDRSHDEFGTQTGPAPSITVAVGSTLDQLPQCFGYTSGSPIPSFFDVFVPLQVDPDRLFLYVNEMPSQGYTGESQIELSLDDILSPFGQPVPVLPIDVLFQQGPNTQVHHTQAVRDTDGSVVVPPILLGAITPDPLTFRVEVPPQAGIACLDAVVLSTTTPDQPTAIELALVRAEAQPGRVRLEWHSPDAAALTATVYRRGEAGDWAALGTVLGDGNGRIVFEDATVSAGRYAYRLGYADGAAQRLSDAVWVDVPAAVRFALQGAWPNPARGKLLVAFALPSREPATLGLYDLSGRRLAARDVGALGAGRHVVPVAEGLRLAPGLYWLRLTQGAAHATAKAVVAQ